MEPMLVEDRTDRVVELKQEDEGKDAVKTHFLNEWQCADSFKEWRALELSSWGTLDVCKPYSKDEKWEEY